jgi:hypothetical protein
MTAIEPMGKLATKLKLLNEYNWHPTQGSECLFPLAKSTLSRTARNVKYIFSPPLPSCHCPHYQPTCLFAQLWTLDSLGIEEYQQLWDILIYDSVLSCDLCTLTYYSQTEELSQGNFRENSPGMSYTGTGLPTILHH